MARGPHSQDAQRAAERPSHSGGGALTAQVQQPKRGVF
jgi:hypothetical protein